MSQARVAATWVAAQDFFVARVPLLPLGPLVALGDALTAPEAPGDPAAIARDRDAVRVWLRNTASRPEVRDALFIASPSFESSLQAWLARPPAAGATVEYPLARYLSRMSARPTPFGLMAGHMVGRLGERTRLDVAPLETVRRSTRLSVDYLRDLCQTLASDPRLSGRFVYAPNDSLWLASDGWRYLQSNCEPGSRTFQFVSLSSSVYVTAAIECARGGVRPEALVAALRARFPSLSAEGASGFVASLIESDVLVSNLAPPVSGREPLEATLHALAAADVPDAVQRPLAYVRDALAALDDRGLGAEPAAYAPIADALGVFGPVPDASRLFVVDHHRAGDGAALGPDVLAAIERAIDVLSRTQPPRQSASLDGFRGRFVERYGDRFVPLTEALDPQRGVGFQTSLTPGGEPAPLLDGMPRTVADTLTTAWGARETALLGLIVRAAARGVIECALDAQDLAVLAAAEPCALPDALAALAVVAARSDAALAQGDARVRVELFCRPPGVQPLGRFAHADPALRDRLVACARDESAAAPDVILADLATLPGGRSGNIVAHPVFRDYEIQYLGHSGVDEARKIHAADLLVTVRDDAVLLFSERLGREVRPRLAVAYRPTDDDPPVAHFLAELSGQGTPGRLAWRWGALERAPFLPRVVVDRVVLSRAQWRLDAAQLARLGAQRGDAVFAAVRELAHELRWPRFVALQNLDREFVVDLRNVTLVEALAESLRDATSAVIVELFPSHDELPAQGEGGGYVHELIVPLHRRATPPPPARSRAPLRPQRARPDGVAPPGGPWLYARLYANSAEIDAILRSVVAPLVAEAIASGAIDRWHFIRYGDPEWHLRLRLRGEPARLRDDVAPALASLVTPLIDAGVVWRVEHGTYQREVERYGGDDGIALAEEFFHADSDAVLAFATCEGAEAIASENWRLAVAGVDRLLVDLGFTSAQQFDLIERARDGLRRRNGVGRDFVQWIGKRYRAERDVLQRLVEPADAPGELRPALEALARRSVVLEPVFARLHAVERAGRLTVPVEQLAAIYCHMHVNRVLHSAAYDQELIVYEFLYRLHDSRRARGRGARDTQT